MSDLNLPGDDDGIRGDVMPGEERLAEEHEGDVGEAVADDDRGEGDIGLGPALAPPS